ncbi:unnamed protein product [Scytosiphon promiscuus]
MLVASRHKVCLFFGDYALSKAADDRVHFLGVHFLAHRLVGVEIVGMATTAVVGFRARRIRIVSSSPVHPLREMDDVVIGDFGREPMLVIRPAMPHAFPTLPRPGPSSKVRFRLQVSVNTADL